MTLPKELNDEIWDFCRSNNITNIDEFKLKLIRQGFTIEKFGATPTPKVIEKIVEVPVEKIVEVPVEKIVEVPVEVTDEQLNEKYLKLLETVKSLTIEHENLKMVNTELTKQLNAEKNKKDLYGEK